MLYQLLHPWHWLTYGQNATAVAALVALVGLVGLYFYTRYTRRMMQLQEATARASITPILVPKGDVEFVPLELEYPPGADLGLQKPVVTEWDAILTIRNIGAGAAIFLRGWCQTVSANFDSDNPMLLERTSNSQEGVCGLTELLRDESTQVTFSGFKDQRFKERWLFAVDAVDQTDTRHQLRVVRTPRANGTTEVSVSMAHQKPRGAAEKRTLKKLLGS